MGSHTWIVRAEARCNQFWLAFSDWPGSAALHYQVCVRVAKYSVARSGLTALGAGLVTPPQISQLFCSTDQIALDRSQGHYVQME
jgi:hypothetical protein